MRIFLRTLTLLPLIVLLGCAEGFGDDDPTNNVISIPATEVIITPPPTTEPPTTPPPTEPPPVSPPVFDPLDTSAIAGLWDATLEFSDGQTDVFYIEFRDNGTSRLINYTGDSFNQGENCHQITEVDFVSVDGAKLYQTVNSDGSAGTEFVASVVDNFLVLEDFGYDVPGEYPPLVGVDPEFNDCNDEPLNPPTTGGENSDTSAIAGIWDFTETFGDQTDVIYTVFIRSVTPAHPHRY